MHNVNVHDASYSCTIITSDCVHVYSWCVCTVCLGCLFFFLLSCKLVCYIHEGVCPHKAQLVGCVCMRVLTPVPGHSSGEQRNC